MYLVTCSKRITGTQDRPKEQCDVHSVITISFHLQVTNRRNFIPSYHPDKCQLQSLPKHFRMIDYLDSVRLVVFWRGNDSSVTIIFFPHFQWWSEDTWKIVVQHRQAIQSECSITFPSEEGNKCTWRNVIFFAIN